MLKGDNVLNFSRKYYIFGALLMAGIAAFFVWKKFWAMAAVFAALFVLYVFLLVRMIIKEKKEAKHSNSFKQIKLIATDGQRRAYQTFYPSLLDGIEDWEREEIEDYIWDCFNSGHYWDMAPLLPKLTKYDGIDALKKGYSSADGDYQRSECAQVLYRVTGDEQYKI